jgi:predicted ATPase
VIEDALASAARTGEREHEPEILRIKGELLTQAGRVDDAEASFKVSLELARAQNARGWELRTALSLVGLWREQGRDKESYDLLAPIYEWFTEGYDTPDLREAKRVLDALYS